MESNAQDVSMTQAYTPGLKISKRVMIHKTRRLPLKGEVRVAKGASVKADTMVATTFLPGPVELVNVSGKLGTDAKEIRKYLLKKEGDEVQSGELLAKQSGLFGLFSSECTSPVSGSIEAVSDATGKVTIRGKPMPINLSAFIEGEVESILPDEGVVVRSWGSHLQGIFGIGGETWGKLAFAVSSPDALLDEGGLTESMSGGIIVGGNRVTLAALKKGVQLGIRAIVVGGVDDQDLREFLGYDLGVAITGSEDRGITLIITEGFGGIAMAEKTFRLLKACEGRLTSVNGATQIRAGVIRPEIFVPYLEETIGSRDEAKKEMEGLKVGSSIRLIREPYFGKLGKIASLPPKLQSLETEAHVRVAEVILDSGERCVVPRANLEMVEE